MTKDQERRIRTLIEEFKKFGNEGFVYMPNWMMTPPLDTDLSSWYEEARANPCGTAACIAGKAGLMEVFREEGFEWIPDRGRFSYAVDLFFGYRIYKAVFTGLWCRKKSIHRHKLCSCWKTF